MYTLIFQPSFNVDSEHPRPGRFQAVGHLRVAPPYSNRYFEQPRGSPLGLLFHLFFHERVGERHPDLQDLLLEAAGAHSEPAMLACAPDQSSSSRTNEGRGVLGPAHAHPLDGVHLVSDRLIHRILIPAYSALGVREADLLLRLHRLKGLDEGEDFHQRGHAQLVDQDLVGDVGLQVLDGVLEVRLRRRRRDWSGSTLGILVLCHGLLLLSCRLVLGFHACPRSGLRITQSVSRTRVDRVPRGPALAVPSDLHRLTLWS
jgi:hypothetical protein